MANQLEDEAAKLEAKKAQHEAECIEIGQFVKAGGQLRRDNMNPQYYVAETITGHDGCDKDPVVALRQAMADEAETERSRQRQFDGKAQTRTPLVEDARVEDPF